MKVRCVYCGYELNLDHKVFDNYCGSIKCYCCRGMMKVETAQGLICSLNQSNRFGDSISHIVAVLPKRDLISQKEDFHQKKLDEALARNARKEGESLQERQGNLDFADMRNLSPD